MMGGHFKHPPELRERAIALRADGLSYREVGVRLGVTRTTVQQWFFTPNQVEAHRRRQAAYDKAGQGSGGRCTRCNNPTITVPPNGLCGFCECDDALVAAGRGLDAAA